MAKAKRVAKKAVNKTAKKAVKKKAIKTAKKAPQKTKKPAQKLASQAGKPGQSSSFEQFVTPLDDRVLIRIERALRKTAGGLFIPDAVATEQAQSEGVVVAVGRGHRSAKGKVRPMDVKVGNRVLFPQYAGSKIQFKDEELVIVRESELMGIVD